MLETFKDKEQAVSETATVRDTSKRELKRVSRERLEEAKTQAIAEDNKSRFEQHQVVLNAAFSLFNALKADAAHVHAVSSKLPPSESQQQQQSKEKTKSTADELQKFVNKPLTQFSHVQLRKLVMTFSKERKNPFTWREVDGLDVKQLRNAASK